MEIRELSPGERPPERSNSVKINVLPNGRAGFSGVYQARNVEAYTVSQNNFDSEHQALRAALEWAEAKDIDTLYLVVDRPDA